MNLIQHPERHLYTKFHATWNTFSHFRHLLWLGANVRSPSRSFYFSYDSIILGCDLKMFGNLLQSLESCIYFSSYFCLDVFLQSYMYKLYSAINVEMFHSKKKKYYCILYNKVEGKMRYVGGEIILPNHFLLHKTDKLSNNNRLQYLTLIVKACQ